MNKPVYIARIKNPRKTLYVVGEPLHRTAAPERSEAEHLARQMFARIPKEMVPEIEIVQLFDSVPNTRGQGVNLEKPLYTVKEAAALMGVSVTTLNRMIARGDMPVVQPGYNQIKRVARQDIEAWIEQNRRVAAYA